MNGEIIDQGTVWWPAGAPAQEKVRFVFNRACERRPAGVTCQDYPGGEALEVEPLSFEQTGMLEWMRYTAAVVRFSRPEQRGRSFRWRLHADV